MDHPTNPPAPADTVGGPTSLPFAPAQAPAGNQFPSQVDTLAAQKEAKANGPGFLGTVGAAFQQENATVRLVNHFTQREFAIDRQFDFEAAIDAPEVKARIDAMPAEAIEGLTSATSADHLQYLLDRVEGDWRREQALDSAGGLIARVGAAVLDPVDVLASLAGGGVGVGIKAGRLGRAITGGVSAASGGIAAESVLVNTSPFRDSSDVLIAGLAGLAIGAPIGALMKGEVDEIARLVDVAVRQESTRVIREESRTVFVPAGAPIQTATNSLGDTYELVQTGKTFVTRITSRDGVTETKHKTLEEALNSKRRNGFDPGAPEKPAQPAQAVAGATPAPTPGVPPAPRGTLPLALVRAADGSYRDDYAGASVVKDGRKWVSTINGESEVHLTLKDARVYLASKGPAAADMEVKPKAADQAAPTPPAAKAAVPEITIRKVVEKVYDDSGQFTKEPVWLVERNGELLARGVDLEDAEFQKAAILEDDAADLAPGRSDFVFTGGAGLFFKHPVLRLARNSENKAARDQAADFDPAELIVNTRVPTFSNILHGSAIDFVRDIAFKILETGVPIAGARAAKVKRFTAEGRANLIHRVQAARMYRAIDNEFAGWAKANGVGRLKRTYGTEQGARFREEVGRAIKGEPDVSVFAKRAAAQIAEVTRDQLRWMKDVGLKGANNVDYNPNYLPRMHKAQNWRSALAEFGEEGMIRVFREGYMRNDPEMTVEIAERLAKLYVRSVEKRTFNLDAGNAHGIDLNDFDSLRAWFGDEADELIEALEAFAARDVSKNAGKIRNLKRRADFDETVGVPLLTKNGDTKLLKISDLMENDVGKVLDRYLQVTGGWIGLAKEANFKSAADVKAMANRIRSEGAAEGRAKAEKEAQAFEDVIKLVTGQHLVADPYSLGNQVSRQVRAYNFMRIGGGFGWAQIAEIGPIIGNATFREFFRAMPDFRKLFTKAADGQLSDDLARELDHMVGSGTDFVRNPAIAGFDEYGVGFDTSSVTGRAMGAMDPLLQSGGRITAAVSGMAPINAWLQRMATRSSAFRMASLAKKHASAADLPMSIQRRFADMGLGKDDLDAIWKDLRAHAKFGKRGKLESLEIDKWDPDTLGTWQMAMNRQQRRVVQENDIGNSFPFMHQEYGKILTQFQTFMINAINKQTIHGMTFRDREMFTGWSLSMFMGGLAYTSQSVLNYAAEPEKLKERLEPTMVARAAFMRAGWASLIPQVADTGLGVAGQDKLFAHARSSGLGSGPLEGNPTYSLLRDAGNIAQLPGRLLLDEDYRGSQQDARRIARASAFGNVTGVRNVVSLLASPLPKQSER